MSDSYEKKEEFKPKIVYSPGKIVENYVFEQCQAPNGESVYIVWDLKNKCLTALEDPKTFTYNNVQFKPHDKLPWKTPSKPTPYGSVEALTDEIQKFICEHVWLVDEDYYYILPEWVKATWVTDLLDSVGYIDVRGGFGHGKTRLLETLQAISFRGILLASVRGAPIFRMTEALHPTLFLDQTEQYSRDEKSDVICLLNAGQRKGQMAVRVEKSSKGKFKLKFFDVFGFKAFAGTEPLAKGLQSRCLQVMMIRNLGDVRKKIDYEWAAGLRNKLLQFRFDVLSRVYGDVVTSENSIANIATDKNNGEIPGRVQEIFEPLLYVASDSRKSKIIDFMFNFAEEWKKLEQSTLDVDIIAAVVELAEGEDLSQFEFTAQDITEKINQGLPEKDKVSSRWVGKKLSELGFIPKRTRTKRLWKINTVRFNKLKAIFAIDNSDVTTSPLPSDVLLFEPIPFGMLRLKCAWCKTNLSDFHAVKTNKTAEQVCADCKLKWERQHERG